MNGEGYVCGANKEKVKVEAGQAVFWEKGEFHETSTEKGLMAIVMEAEDLERAILMPTKRRVVKMIEKANREETDEIIQYAAQSLFEGTRKLSFKYRESD